MRALLRVRKDRPYDRLFYGTNLFQMCEYTHSKRSLQQWLLRPGTVDNYLDLGWIYLTHAENPLQQIGRFGGMAVSRAYGDTIALRSTWLPKVIGKPRRGHAHRWYRDLRPRTQRTVLSCKYDADSIALKVAFTESLLDDARMLATKTYVMLLPDRTVADPDPQMQARWVEHRKLHQALADARPWVELIDLSQGQIQRSNQFRDGFHLKKKSMGLQRRLFDTKLKALVKSETRRVRGQP